MTTMKDETKMVYDKIEDLQRLPKMLLLKKDYKVQMLYKVMNTKSFVSKVTI